MSTQSSNELQREIATINVNGVDSDMEQTSNCEVRNAATQTSPTSPTNEVAVTIDIRNGNGNYHGKHIPLPPLNPSEIMSDYVSPSFFTRKGFIIQFVNNNAKWSPTLIGGFRTVEKDVRKIPKFISINKTVIKKVAVKVLTRHLEETQCGVGATELLCDDDYGMTFSLASLTPQGRNLNPSGRHEGPLFYCLFSGLCEPCYIDQTPGEGVDSAHVVNCYIHLLPSAQRRNSIIAKIKEVQVEAMVKASDLKSSFTTTPQPRMGKAPRPRSHYRPRPYSKNSVQQPSNQRASGRQRQQHPTSQNTIGHAINQAEASKKEANQQSNPPLPSTGPLPRIAGKTNDLPDHL